MISVCIATYNASRYIREQICSILTQLNLDDEIVVADDGSNDETIVILNSIKDNRIKIIPDNGNLGIVKNFERALYAAKGEIIFLSDQDDVWLPTKVSECMSQLESNLMVITDCVVVDSQLNTLYQSFFALRGSRKGFVHNLYKNGYMGCCMAFRRELLSYALPIPSNIPMHDIWLGMLAEFIGDVSFLPKQLLMYRRHTDNASGLESRYGILQKIHFRITLIFFIYYRIAEAFSKRYFKLLTRLFF
jgi:glycosyltransferase involved in cell wall biosynthesis